MLGTFTLFAHRMIGSIKRVKRSVREPSFVKVQIGDVAIEHSLDRLGVVEDTVVGLLGDGHHAGLNLGVVNPF